MRLLLLSNSTNPGEEYLAYARDAIQGFLEGAPRQCLFIPYAGIRINFDEYEEKVARRFEAMGHHLKSIHHYWDPLQAVQEAEVIVIGGGNTFRLVQLLHRHGLMKAIQRQVRKGTPYIGWSAGSNVACPTLGTTNDMPIVDPIRSSTLRLVPFQINPHFSDQQLPDFGGETREERIQEYTELNPGIYVVGLRESTLLRREGDHLRLVGPHPARIFRKGTAPLDLTSTDDLSFLLEKPIPSYPFN